MIEGGSDKLLPPGWAKEIADQIPHGRSAVIDGAGHCPQIEQSSIVNELLLEFLADADTDQLARLEPGHAKRAQSWHSSFVKVRTVCC